MVNITLQQSPNSVEELRQVFNQIDENSCPYNYNFHLHTVCSDGKLTPTEVIRQAMTIGLQGLAITDHHSVNGYELAKICLQEQEIDRLKLWTGIEITSNLGGIDVHILGYGFDTSAKDLQPYIQGDSPTGKEAKAAYVINSIHQAGGLAVLAHPARYRRSLQELIPLAAELGIDGVESYYAYKNPNPWIPSQEEMAQVKELADNYNLFHTCGTDTHGLNLLLRL